MRNPLLLNSDRILELLKEAGVSQARIATTLGIPASAVSNLYKGTRRMKLIEANVLMELIPAQPSLCEIPVIGLAGAGKWVEAIEQSIQIIPIPGGFNTKGRFAVEVAGDSMNLVLSEGSFAIIDPDDTRLFSGKIYLLLNAEGEATIKRYKSDPARFEPASDNPEYVPFELGSSDFSVIGRVTAGMQKF